MKLKVFTLKHTPDRGGFDDAEMLAFLSDKQVLSVQEHFFTHEQSPTWALLVSYRDVDRPGQPRPGQGDPRIDWRSEVADEDRPLFDALRKWRGERAKRDGRPPYILLTNRQMAEIARLRPKTLAALREIQGIGEAKADGYGGDVLALVERAAPGVAERIAGGVAAPEAGAEVADVP